MTCTRSEATAAASLSLCPRCGQSLTSYHHGLCRACRPRRKLVKGVIPGTVVVAHDIAKHQTRSNDGADADAAARARRVEIYAAQLAGGARAIDYAAGGPPRHRGHGPHLTILGRPLENLEPC